LVAFVEIPHHAAGELGAYGYIAVGVSAELSNV
jgi:hypothetical protein